MLKKLSLSVGLLAIFVITFNGSTKATTLAVLSQASPAAIGTSAVGGQWLQLTPTNTGPGVRFDHAMQYHAATQQVFFFGGRTGNPSGQSFNDTWVLDLSTLTWRQLAVSAPSKPGVRHSAVMMVDAAGQHLYITAGQIGTGSKYNDIWRLNLSTEVWQNLSTTAGTPPQARYASAGGNINGNLIISHGFADTRYDDTWIFNTSTNTWQNVIPLSSAGVPLRRCLLASATAGSKLVMHGGCASGFGPCPLDDTWILDTSNFTWQQISGSTKPSAREYHSLAYFADRNQVVLFGGDASSNKSQPRNDLWVLDLNTQTWETISAASGPSARFSHAAVWIQAVGSLPSGMLVYGGTPSGANGSGLSDLWLFKFTNSPVRFNASSYSVAESTGNATISVTRTGDLTGTVTINYATSNGTALAGSDYTAKSGTLSFGSGEAGPKTFTIPLTSDTQIEGNETINLTLSNPGGGAILGSPNTAVLTIVDDDGADLALTQSVLPNPGSMGKPVTFTLTVFNNGPQTATGVTLTNTLPLSITFGSISATQGTCNKVGGVVTCDLGILNDGTQVVATLVITPTSAGNRTNHALVTATEADPDTNNNSGTANTLTFEGEVRSTYLPVVRKDL